MKYQNSNPFEKLKADEPWFFVRAQDKLSVPLIQEYRNFLLYEGVPDEDLVSLYELLSAFRKWQKENRHLVKMPD